VRDHAADRVQPGLPHGFQEVKVRHVSLDAGNIVADGPDRRQPRLTAPRYEDVRALMHKLLRCRQANAAIAASNEGNFPFQLPRRCVWPPLLDTMVCSACGLQALQDIEPRQRPTGLLDESAIAQIA
jgi:hypothetical protein